LCALEYQTSVREKLSSEEVDLIITQAITQLKALFVEAVDKTDLYTLFGNYLSRGVINKIDIPDLIEAAKSEIRARIEGGAKCKSKG